MPTRKPQIAHKIHFQITDDQRTELDQIAGKYDLVHTTGQPRSAEIVRVLLVSWAHATESPASRISRALRANVMMVLSGQMGLVLAALRRDVDTLMRSTIYRRAPIADEPPEDQFLLSGGRRNQIMLTLDDYLHDDMVAAYNGYKQTVEKATTGKFMRMVLDDTLANMNQHEQVLAIYASIANKTRNAIREAAKAGQETVSIAIRDIELQT